MDTLQELLTEELRDLYDAEKQLTKALPKMARAASGKELKQAFTDHLEVTKTQVARLEECFELLGQKAKGKPCKGMKGLIEEGQEHMSEHEKGAMLDNVLVSSAERVEHYEMAGYLSARAIAKSAGQSAVAGLLGATLKEEEQTGKLLLQIGQQSLQEMKTQAAPAKQTSRAASSKKSGSSQAGKAGSNQTTDHDEIRVWAEERGAKPASVKGTGKKGTAGLLRLDFPGYTGGESLQEISWDDFFKKFDEEGLALLYQEKTAKGQKSNFNKLVSRI